VFLVQTAIVGREGSCTNDAAHETIKKNERDLPSTTASHDIADS